MIWEPLARAADVAGVGDPPSAASSSAPDRLPRWIDNVYRRFLMFKGRFRLPSPALVLARWSRSRSRSVGTAFAANTVATAKHKSKHKDAKADTKLVKKLAPKLNVKHAKTANTAKTTARDARDDRGQRHQRNQCDARDQRDSATNATTLHDRRQCHERLQRPSFPEQSQSRASRIGKPLRRDRQRRQRGLVSLEASVSSAFPLAAACAICPRTPLNVNDSECPGSASDQAKLRQSLRLRGNRISGTAAPDFSRNRRDAALHARPPVQCGRRRVRAFTGCSRRQDGVQS